MPLPTAARRRMDKAQIEREIHRLAPWYYDLDVCGVRTSIAPACDDYGHRPLDFPTIETGYWRGKSVLDVGCNEGAWSFGARAAGARSVDAFDCRQDNIDKARFVAAARGLDGVTFHVESADSWIERHASERFDKVLLCGILYHLTEPWQTIAQYCAIADESIFVSCVLRGLAEPGYTRYRELDNVAASDGSLDSLMPNNKDTLLAEFAKHGFLPTAIHETGEGRFGGGCYLLLERTPAKAWKLEPRVGDGADFDLFLTPLSGSDPQRIDVQATLYNRSDEPRTASASLSAVDARGRVVHALGPRRVDFDARVPRGDSGWSRSQGMRVSFDAPAALPLTIELRLEDPSSGQVLAEARATLQA